jgi:hypothetical protein
MDQHQPKFEDETAELEVTEDYVVLDDATTGGSHLDLSNLRKRKIKIISSAKETIENGELPFTIK